MVDRLEKLPEVGSGHPYVEVQSVFVIGRDGRVVGGNGPPGIAYNDSGGRSITGKPVVEVTRGRLPRRAGEVALDVDTARKAGYGVGDTARL